MSIDKSPFKAFECPFKAFERRFYSCLTIFFSIVIYEICGKNAAKYQNVCCAFTAKCFDLYG